MGYPFGSALVTGASSGIGAAMADLLGDAGIPTVVVARRRDRLAAIAERHATVEVLPADLTTDHGRGAVAERIRSTRAPVELVVNNAGFGTSGTFADLAAERLAAEVDLNVATLTRLSHAALATMVPRGRGWLLNVASVAAFQPAPRLAVYAATKAYVLSLTEALHEETRGTGVRVSALCPGLTRTEFQSVSSSEHYVDQFPGVVWTDVGDVARAGLDGVARGRAVIVPGLVYKGLAAVTGITPRGVARRVSGLVQRG